MPSAWYLGLGAVAFAMLCTAPSAAAAAAPLSSAASGPAAAQPPAAFAGFVAEAAHRFNIPASWITAVMHVESNGDAHAVSPKGAMGLMQIMPRTWSDLRKLHHLRADPFDPQDNILAGAAYLRSLYDRFGAGGFLAAYQAGPSRLADAMTGGRMLGPDTQAYLQRLAELLPDLPLRGGRFAGDSVSDWRTADLFPAPESPDHDTALALAPQADGLFVAVRKAGQP